MEQTDGIASMCGKAGLRTLLRSMVDTYILGKTLLNFLSVKLKGSFRELGKQGSQCISHVTFANKCPHENWFCFRHAF